MIIVAYKSTDMLEMIGVERGNPSRSLSSNVYHNTFQSVD